MEGHHISQNYTIVNGHVDGWTELLRGQSGGGCARVRARDLRVPGNEEDLGRALVTSLDAGQEKTATVDEKAPGEILSSRAKRRESPSPR